MCTCLSACCLRAQARSHTRAGARVCTHAMTFIFFVNGKSKGYKDFAKSPNPNKPIFLFVRRDACKLLSKPYFSFDLIKSNNYG